MVSEPRQAYLGLGGNIGDVVEALRHALQTLDDHIDAEVTAVSPVYLTPPWGIEDQPWFHNACAEVKTSLRPHELLELCMEIEASLQRVRDQRWGPRTIDLDILIYAEEQLSSDTLTIPHPRITERQFVLQPLSDIAPDVLIKGKTCEQWIAEQDWPPLNTLDLAKDWWKAP